MHVIYIYIYIRTKVTRCICVNCTFVSEPLNHIRQDMKSARLTAVCEGSFIGPFKMSLLIRSRYLNQLKCGNCIRRGARSFSLTKGLLFQTLDFAFYISAVQQLFHVSL